jgi:hypothetical protein
MSHPARLFPKHLVRPLVKKTQKTQPTRIPHSEASALALAGLNAWSFVRLQFFGFSGFYTTRQRSLGQPFEKEVRICWGTALCPMA